MPEKTVHWCNWASQPCIQIACTKESFHPWGHDPNNPKDVYNADLDDHPDILYTFDEPLVTCEECKSVEGFQQQLDQINEFKRKVAESGMSEDEYVEAQRQKFLATCEERRRQ